jgi:hypothetical protein
MVWVTFRHGFAALVIALGIARATSVAACDVGECAFPTGGGTFCGPCSGCNGPNQCLQGHADICITCGGPCQPRNDGLQGCGGPAACVNSTFPCTGPAGPGVKTCCSCTGTVCGGQCCDADQICNPGEGGSCSKFRCESGVGCFGQCCAKSEVCSSKTLSCQSSSPGGHLCGGAEKACVDPSNGSVTCCNKGQACQAERTGYACVPIKSPCKGGQYCTKTDVRGQKVRICCAKGKHCGIDPFGSPSCT